MDHSRLTTTRAKGKPASDIRIPCRFHARGSCSKGGSCPFAHGDSNGDDSTNAASSNPGHPLPAPPPSSTISCRFFSAGTCAKGPSCPFLHADAARIPGPKGPTISQHNLSSLLDSRSHIPCQFFARGSCRNGAACPFQHGGTSMGNGDNSETSPHDANQDDNTPDDWIRDIGGAIVAFGDGAAVSKLSLPSDFSAVRLSNLPSDSTPTSVAALLLKTIGDDVVREEHVVRVFTVPGGTTTCSADIKMEDPMFATTVCGKLRSQARLEATPIPPPMQGGTSNIHRVDCRKLHCSWHRPTRTAWLNFGTEGIAHKVHDKFNAGVYKILGSSVTAGAPTGGEGSGWRNPLAWSVMLTGLPGNAKKQDVLQPIPDYHRPRHIELGDPSYKIDPVVANTIVESMFSQFGPLESWRLASGSQGKRVKAQARFVDESHAREAAAALNNKSLPFGKTTRLTVQLVTSTKFKIWAQTYDVVRDQIEAQKSGWEKMHIQFIVYPPANGYRVLKLEGQDSKLIAAAKDTLGHIVGGQVVVKDGKTLWNSAFRRNTSDELQRIKQVEQECRVVILRDKFKSQLRVFGSEQSCQKATKRLATLVGELEQVKDSADGQIIELDAEEFQWACRGGFGTMVSNLGSNKAMFDIVSRPARIIIMGSRDDYHTATTMVRSRQDTTNTQGSRPTNQETQDCSVCWTEAEDAIRTTCDHVYCLGCFIDLCQAAGSSTANETLISCVGDQARCGKVLTLGELQNHLSSAIFEDLLASSVSCYVGRRPDVFRYCPTPDCGRIYRSSVAVDENGRGGSKVKTFTCPQCLIPTCTACHAPHPGMTCAEHKDVALDGGKEALELLRKKLGIKDCPKCKTAMEKVDGCNHMTCGGCGTHICWVCMEHFATSRECYDHLNRQHGGAFAVGDDGLF
ncbi:hypothetical protein QBC37DRAFT_95807 [Rhypophila decipiens]|uniref:Uncharacterized protein n=1 Tax=Rhypophila decipiens TaxID=261697 RepID=A0AAN6XVI0_9PEZI|nr:hypothetical protein QBC37DRAFT_95807 [Rhypophila decipiens]